MADKVLIINRKETVDLNYKSNSYYDLKHIKTLPQESRDDLLFIVKKINLSASFKFFEQGITISFIILIHFGLFLGNLFVLLCKREIINDANITILFEYFCKYILTNSLFLLFWLLIYFGIVRPLTSLNIVVYRLSTFILEVENYHNNKFKYQLLPNFSIKVTPIKLLNENDKKETIDSLNLCEFYSNSPFEYVINIHLIFFGPRYLGNKLYEKEDVDVIRSFDEYFQKEITKNTHAFLKECVLPTVITWIINVILSKEKYSLYLNEVVIITVVMIIFIWLLRIKRIRDLTINLRKYMYNLNKELIPKGKFIYREKNLLSLFSLNSNGKLYDVNEMNHYIQRIFYTNITSSSSSVS